MKIATWNVNSPAGPARGCSSSSSCTSPTSCSCRRRRSSRARSRRSSWRPPATRPSTTAPGAGRAWRSLAREGLALTDVRPASRASRTDRGALDRGRRWAGCASRRVYVTNGRAIGTPTFAEKLAFLDAMRARLRRRRGARDRRRRLQRDARRHRRLRPGRLRGRDARDARRARAPAGDRRRRAASTPTAQFAPATSSSSRGGTTARATSTAGIGLRIDLLLVRSALAGACEHVGIDRNFRKGPKPSDHAPLLMDLTLPGG